MISRDTQLVDTPKAAPMAQLQMAAVSQLHADAHIPQRQMAELDEVELMLQGREIKDAVSLGLVHQQALAASSPLGLLAAARGRQVFMVDVAAYAATLEIDAGELSSDMQM